MFSAFWDTKFSINSQILSSIKQQKNAVKKMSNFTYVFIAEGCLWLKLSAKIELRGSVKLQLAQLRD